MVFIVGGLIAAIAVVFLVLGENRTTTNAITQQSERTKQVAPIQEREAQTSNKIC